MPDPARMLGSRLVAVLVLLPLSLGACLTPPPAVVSIPAGEVRASNPELAQEVAEYTVATQAELERRLPGLREADFDVWVQDRIRSGLPAWVRPGHATGLAIRRSDSPTCRVHVLTNEYRKTLPHELTHALLGADWDLLPALVEEGVCELMNVALSPEDQLALGLLVCAETGTELLAATPGGADSLSLGPLLARSSSRDLSSGTLEEALYAYGMAYFLVDRIERRRGLPHLLELCLRAREESLDIVPSAWILEAADLEPTTDLMPLLTADVDRALFDYLLQSGELERMLARIEKTVTESPEHANWSFATVTVTYAIDDLPDLQVERPLVDLPGFERWRAGISTSKWPHFKP